MPYALVAELKHEDKGKQVEACSMLFPIPAIPAFSPCPCSMPDFNTFGMTLT